MGGELAFRGEVKSCRQCAGGEVAGGNTKAPRDAAIAVKVVEVVPFGTRLSIGHSIFWVPGDTF